MSAGATRISGTSDSLIEYARQLLATAKRLGADEAEVYGMAGRSVDVDLRKDQVELASESFHRGLGLRAVVRGAVGFSSTSDMTRLEVVASSAVKSARARGGDESWRSLPQPEIISTPKNIFDASIDRIGPEECLDLAAGILQGCYEVKGAKPASGGVACISGMEFVVNSQGIEISEKGTSMHASIETIAKGSDIASGTEFQNSRLLESDLKGVGRAAAEMAVSSLGGKKAESGSFDVILKPVAFMELLEYAFMPSISADNVQKGRSHLAGRLGESIGSEHLNITDDGLLSGGMGTSAFDGEGVASRKIAVIENGVLKSFLYDSYTAGKAGLKSTGNAVRSGYSEVPMVGLRNMIVSSNESFDLQADTKGILVNSLIGAHTANPISGDFSVEARNSFYIAPGKVPQPISSMMLAGNIFDLLRNIDVGTDLRAVGVIITPSVRVRMKVVGS
jgi:PmbA protein